MTNDLLVLLTISLSLSVMVRWLEDLLPVCEGPSHNPGMGTCYNGRGSHGFPQSVQLNTSTSP
jgi:hypothetical protein